MVKYTVVTLLVIVTASVFVSNASQKTITQHGVELAQVNVPGEMSDFALIGQKGFDANCASCHGQNAAGQNGIAPPLVHKIYEPSHHGDESFQRAVAMGVRAHHWKFGNMPAIEGLTRADVKAITAYVRELQRHNGIN